ncbi:TrbC/VirB2 family protein [Rubrivirga litoralis]|uniref:TrbC/VirB2 family protein n=1 Tax=Rubrivirga litoralis TaxID=3075598 RepID=A0ABU3BUI3_9BACT|nr:TrbC/VirB2 family protein [Rubrivirga sp. F394]MDT0632952.1 TrbC/VirB2 family protein [Rubrivirga sp. F394]
MTTLKITPTTVLVGRALLIAAAVLVLAPDAAAGGGASMPFDGTLQTIAGWLTGTGARLLAVIAVAVGGIMWAFTRHEEGVKRIAQAALGFGIAVGATSLVATLGFGGATL